MRKLIEWMLFLWKEELFLPEFMIRIIATTTILAALLYSHTNYPNLPLLLVGIIALFATSKGMLKYTALLIIFLLIVYQSIELSAYTLTEENINVFRRLSLQITLSIIIFALLFLPRTISALQNGTCVTDLNRKKLIFYVNFLLYVAPAFLLLFLLDQWVKSYIRIANGTEFVFPSIIEKTFEFNSIFVDISLLIFLTISVLYFIIYTVSTSLYWLYWVRKYNEYSATFDDVAAAAELTRGTTATFSIFLLFIAHNELMFGFLAEVAVLAWTVYWYWYFSASEDIKDLSCCQHQKYVDGLSISDIIFDISFIVFFLLIIHASTLKEFLIRIG